MNLLKATTPVEQHALQPGSRAWLEHRFGCNNASDAPAMLGCDEQRSRNDLMATIYAGFAAEVSSFKQAIYDRGHRYEALALPLGEAVMGEELYPLVLSRDFRAHHITRKLGASCDGSTIARTANWEHKQMNQALADALPYVGPQGVHLNDAAALPKKYRVQMEQQLMVNDASRCLFTASAWADDDTLIEERHCWYYPDAALRAEIIAGWVQFEADLANYTPVEVIDKPTIVARSPDQLPAIRSEVRGQLVVESNIKEWEEAALAYIKAVREHELKTDEDFENADAAAKWCDASKLQLQGVKANLMGHTGDVNVAVGTLDRIMAELDATRLAFNKAIAARKEARKGEIVEASKKALTDYIATLDADLAKMLPEGTRALMPPPTHAKIEANFPKCLVNKRSFKNMQDALDQELARAKIAAGALRDLFRANYLLLKEEGKDHGTLFPDWRDLLYTETELLRPLVRQRIADHKAEQDRIAREAEEKRQREEAAQREREEAAAKARQEAEQRSANHDRAVATAREIAETAERAGTPAASPTVQQLRPAAGFAGEPDTTQSPAPLRGNSLTGRGVAQQQPVNVGPVDGARHAVPANEATMGPVDLKLGEIVTLTGVGLTEDFLEELGFPAAKRDRNARLYHRGALPAILDALIRHHAEVRNSLHLPQKEAA